MSGAETVAVIGALASAAGTAYQANEQSNARDRQDKAAAAEVERQRLYQKQIDEELANTMQNLQQLKDTEQTTDNFAAEQENKFKGIVDNIDVNNASTIMGQGTNGRVSDAYVSRLAKNKSTEIAKTSELARLLGRVAAPSQSGLDRGLSYNDSNLNMMPANRNAQRSAGLLQGELAQAGQTDNITGAVLAGVGNAGMSGAFDGLFKPSAAALKPAAQAWGGSTAYSPIPASQQKAPLSFIKSKALT